MKSYTASLIVAVTLLCASGFLPAHAEDDDDDCPMKAMVKESIEHCIGELSDENKELLTNDKKADNPEIRCFQACVLNHAEVLKDGKFDMDKIEETINKNVEESERENWMAATNKCREEAEKQDEECDIAGTFINCFKQFKDAQSTEK